jgi:hypothetical protein
MATRKPKAKPSPKDTRTGAETVKAQREKAPRLTNEERKALFEGALDINLILLRNMAGAGSQSGCGVYWTHVNNSLRALEAIAKLELADAAATSETRRYMLIPGDLEMGDNTSSPTPDATDPPN